jgi:hypothetical protein
MDMVNFAQMGRKVVSTKQIVAMQPIVPIPQTLENLIQIMGLQSHFSRHEALSEYRKLTCAGEDD